MTRTAKESITPLAVSPAPAASPAPSASEEISNATSPAASTNMAEFLLPAPPTWSPTGPSATLYGGGAMAREGGTTLRDTDAANVLTLLANGQHVTSRVNLLPETGRRHAVVVTATPPLLSTSAVATTAAPTMPKGGRRSRKLSTASDSNITAGGVERKQTGRKVRQNAEVHVAYRQKRQRNNEAVRKCRIKKKEQSEERERQVAELEALVAKLRRENEALRTQLGRDSSSVHNTCRGTSVAV